jgi:hypothetical protein
MSEKPADYEKPSVEEIDSGGQPIGTSPLATKPE